MIHPRRSMAYTLHVYRTVSAIPRTLITAIRVIFETIHVGECARPSFVVRTSFTGMCVCSTHGKRAWRAFLCAFRVRVFFVFRV